MNKGRAMLWLALHFPHLGLELASAAAEPGSADEPADAPRVLIERQGQRSLIVDACAQARQAGIAPGQPLTQAQLLLPTLYCNERDPLAERQALTHLAACAYHYSPLLQLEAPNGLLLEIGGSLQLHRHAAISLLQTLQARLMALGFHAAAGLGRTPTAARLRAQLAGEGLITSAFVAASPERHPSRPSIPALDPLPVQALPLPTEQRHALQDSGICNLAALRRLPRASLQRRYGGELGRFLDRLEGRLAEPIRPWRPAPDHQASIELPAPTAQGEGLRFPLRRLIGDLCLALRARDACVQSFDLRFELERDGSEAPLSRAQGSGKAGRQSRLRHRTRNDFRAAEARDFDSHLKLSIQLLAPSRDPQQLEALVQQRLERLPLPGRVLVLSLSAAALQPYQALQGDLFDSRLQSSRDWPVLLERLRARLGEAQLLQLQSRLDHRPEQALGLAPVSPGDPSLTSARTRIEAKPSSPAHLSLAESQATDPRQTPDLTRAPLWLLPEPEACCWPPQGPIEFLERIEGGWWDGNDIRRDYYRLLETDGSRHWLYHDPRQPELARRQGSYG